MRFFFSFFGGGGGNQFTFKYNQVLKKLPTDVLVKYKVNIGPVSNEISHKKRSRVFPKGFGWIKAGCVLVLKIYR